jgi:hypothetical protein
MKAVRVVLLALTALAAQNSSAFTPNSLSVVRPYRASSRPLSVPLFLPTAAASAATSTQLQASTQPLIPMENAINDDLSMRDEYDKWREKFKKGDFDPVRFQYFTSNYTALMGANAVAVKRAKELGMQVPSLMSLNEYGDMSLDEYRAIRAGQAAPERKAEATPSATVEPLVIPRAINAFMEAKNPGDIVNGATLDMEKATMPSANANAGKVSSFDPGTDRIRIAYTEWCGVFGKEPEEDRFKVFESHYTSIEKHCEQTGKKMKLNAYADFTADEYARLMKLGAAGANGAVASTTANSNKLSDPGFLRQAMADSQPVVSSSADQPTQTAALSSPGYANGAASTYQAPPPVASSSTPKPGGSYLETPSNQGAANAPSTPATPAEITAAKLNDWKLNGVGTPLKTLDISAVAPNTGAPPTVPVDPTAAAMNAWKVNGAATAPKTSDTTSTVASNPGVSPSASLGSSFIDSLKGKSSATTTSNPGSYMDSYYKPPPKAADAPIPAVSSPPPEVADASAATLSSPPPPVIASPTLVNGKSSSMGSISQPPVVESTPTASSAAVSKPTVDEPPPPPPAWNSLTTSIGRTPAKNDTPKPSFLDSLNNLVGGERKPDPVIAPKFQSMEDYANSLKFPSDSSPTPPSVSPLNAQPPKAAPKDIRATLPVGAVSYMEGSHFLSVWHAKPI